ncbi:prepilin peptidase [Serratia symbiotica]|uniref:Prepilin leader peptidase/N-methyltransferase n=1 Tax=Serratia symbiotica TaxID=138074 RepID=A0A068Z3E6_9GAMM|nr:A24 family peptidase [Serratia symbiotica]MBF1994351.1 prepilin peptidase [Serratia symbiotica]MBQ0954817.1 prepilin peptidase [Serratia symbiotica]QLH63830.1 prepilin peptidase [Serratia symbiotica]QTP14270.1 prepilin peptidase [Serratia symbiotica]CDS55484.1 Type 4 prepilin-like proteins leader peptide processing enzyme [Serratia symbiotica]
MHIMLFMALGAIIGSFLNVVIYRLPLIMAGEKMSLSYPASGCPLCGAKIRWHHNLPLLGWLLLAGRCTDCHHPISWRYPLVELLTAALFALLIHRYGLTLQGGYVLVAACLLVVLAGIDQCTMLLPDRLTLPLCGLGIVCAFLGEGRVSGIESLAASALGFLVPWLLDRLFYLWRRHPGMGMGDMKLFAALGAWFGMTGLWRILAFSPLLALLSALLVLRTKLGEPFPFGPYPIALALAMLVWG